MIGANSAQRTAPAGYDDDFALWAEEAAALREGRFADLVTAHLLEEIDALSNRKDDELLTRLTNLTMHPLKCSSCATSRGRPGGDPKRQSRPNCRSRHSPKRRTPEFERALPAALAGEDLEF
jgi:hypothetical protein